MIQAVLFDIDGTLLDSVELHARAWRDALALYGHDVPLEDLRRQIGKGGDHLLPVFIAEDELARVQEELEAERSKLFQRDYLPGVKPFPKVRELFERILSEGKRIGLASSGKADEVEKYEKIAGIADLVEAKTTADDAEESKPSPDIFVAAIAKMKGIPVDRMIAIGDTPYDAQAAGKVGLRTIGLLSGGFPEADLREAGCVAVYRDPADLLARYDESPLAER